MNEEILLLLDDKKGVKNATLRTMMLMETLHIVA